MTYERRSGAGLEGRVRKSVVDGPETFHPLMVLEKKN